MILLRKSGGLSTSSILRDSAATALSASLFSTEYPCVSPFISNIAFDIHLWANAGNACAGIEKYSLSPDSREVGCVYTITSVFAFISPDAEETSQ